MFENGFPDDLCGPSALDITALSPGAEDIE